MWKLVENVARKYPDYHEKVWISSIVVAVLVLG
jgi:hypothetical protein